MQPIFVIEGNVPHLAIPPGNQRRLSIISKEFDNEHYDRQVQALASDLSQPLSDQDGITNRRRVTQLMTVVENQEESDPVKLKGYHLLLFIVEPIVNVCVFFPILVLFWDCGWNLLVTMVNALNNYPLMYNLDDQNYTAEEYGNYAPQSLVVPYVITEILLLILYLGQDLIYNFLKQQHFIIENILLRLHALLLAFLYISQWEMIWTLLYQYIPQDWSVFMLLSLAAIFLLIVITGTLSDLVCSPFVVCFDSIEYCIRFACPLATKNITRWKVHLINFILYEIIISNLTIFGWFGFYTILDQNLYPDDRTKSAWICLVIGYLLFFPLIYCQRFFDKINLKFELLKVLSENFPQFYRNVYHSLAFASCLFIWRGFWVMYDEHVRIFELYYKTYLLLSMLLFGVLSVLHSFSSINGPLDTMEDNYHFFPVYSHCYVSMVIHKLSQLSYCKSFITTATSRVSPAQNEYM